MHPAEDHCEVGPLTGFSVGITAAAPLDRAGIPVQQPDRARLGSLVRTVADAVPRARTRRVTAAGQSLEIRGHGVLVDGRHLPLPPTAMTLLGRLTALGNPRMIQTLVKRGDRIAFDPEGAGRY